MTAKKSKGANKNTLAGKTLARRRGAKATGHASKPSPPSIK